MTPKFVIIVEETVQHVYEVDATDENLHRIQALQGLCIGSIVESLPMAWDNPPRLLGKRAKKGAAMPLLLREIPQAADYRRFTGVRTLWPDETGKHVQETICTNKTVVRKSITS
jgi:hypothetical protein